MPDITPNPTSLQLGLAAEAWIAVNCNYGFGKPTEEECHEADITLEVHLLAHGVMRPTEAVEEIYASDDQPAVCIVLESGATILIDATTGEYSVAHFTA